MGNKDIKCSTEEQKSDSSVLNLSLNSNKSQNSNPLNENNNSDIQNELKEDIILPIENEFIESSELFLDKKEEEFKIKQLIENKDENENVNANTILNKKKRSKTYMPKISIKKSPKPHPLESNEYISPLKLSIKSFGNFPKWTKKPNSVLYDFQKTIIDCRSCNDEESLDDIFLFSMETERTTPNLEDLQNLLDCRKKMTTFRNSLNERLFKEYENILNSDYMFDENKEINISNSQQKKNNFWYKHIKQQQLKDKMNNIHFKRLASEPIVKISDNVKNEENHGLFILGILESAANERKGRNTVNV